MKEEIYFLTDNIRITKRGMEYINNNNFKLITKRNWHKILNEYGWEKIPKKWIINLNKLSKIHEKNSLYGIMDVNITGNCFFECIAYALNEKNRGSEIYYNGDDVRFMISDNLTEEQYDMIINYYRIMKDANDFDENWDPYSIQSIDDFKEKLNTS